MDANNGSVNELIDQLGRLPGVGRKSAERLAYHLLRVSKSEALALSDAIRAVRENVSYCSVCYNLAEGPLCAICLDPRARSTQIVRSRTASRLDGGGAGGRLPRLVSRVLLGRIAPLEGIGPDQLTIDALGPSRPPRQLWRNYHGHQSHS
jgi:recombination protein RecR